MKSLLFLLFTLLIECFYFINLRDHILQTLIIRAILYFLLLSLSASIILNRRWAISLFWSLIFILTRQVLIMHQLAEESRYVLWRVILRQLFCVMHHFSVSLSVSDKRWLLPFVQILRAYKGLPHRMGIRCIKTSFYVFIKIRNTFVNCVIEKSTRSSC